MKKAAEISRQRGKEKDPFPSQKLQAQQRNGTTGGVSHPLVRHSREQVAQWSPKQLPLSSDKRNKSSRSSMCVNAGLDVPLSEVQLVWFSSWETTLKGSVVVPKHCLEKGHELHIHM